VDDVAAAGEEALHQPRGDEASSARHANHGHRLAYACSGSHHLVGFHAYDDKRFFSASIKSK